MSELKIEKLVIAVVSHEAKLVYTFSSDAYKDLTHKEQLARFKKQRLNNPKKFANLGLLTLEENNIELTSAVTIKTKSEINKEWISKGYASQNG